MHHTHTHGAGERAPVHEQIDQGARHDLAGRQADALVPICNLPEAQQIRKQPQSGVRVLQGQRGTVNPPDGIFRRKTRGYK